MMADWTKMLPELLELISDRLSLLDFITFRSVCRKWRLAPSGRSEITKFSKDHPWLMFYGIQNNSNIGGMCYLYSRSHSKCCTVYLPELQDATVLESKFGWLLAHRGEHFFLFNFTTHEKICLPKHTIISDQACTFTTFPTNKDCTVFIVSRRCESVIELSSCRIHDDKSWKVKAVSISKDAVSAMTAVHCCSCTYDNSHCKCKLKNKIAIYGKGKYSLYDYVEEKVTNHRRIIKVKSSCTDNWYDDVKNANGRDWLARFGEKGILISLCARSFWDGTYMVGMCRWQDIHTANGEHKPNVELNNIKGVLIDFKLPLRL